MMKQNRNGSRACCAKGVETEGLVIVKARRGEATDTHSIAERARRAKIRMRMKLLQSLVPGCDKITGKAHVLDETIKYVQFLQNQVESLAAKIAIVDHPLFGCQHNVNKNASASEGMLPYLPESSAVSFMCSADTMPSDPASLVLTQNQEANVIPQANQKQVQ